MRKKALRSLATCLLAGLTAMSAGCAGGRQKLRSEALAPAPADSSAMRRELLAARLDSLLADTLLAQAQYGIYIVEVGSGRPVYARNFQQLLVPASANKLFATALALRRLGTQHRFVTEALGDSIGRDGALRGNLYLRGSGDPGLATEGLVELAYRLAAAGLRRVAGKLVLDAGAFDTARYGPGWMWDEGPYAYNAPVSALSVNRNTFEIGISAGPRPGDSLRVRLRPPSAYFKVDNQGVTSFPGVRRSLKVTRQPDGETETVSVSGVLSWEESPQFLVRSVADPSRYCGRLFREALKARGITIAGRSEAGRTPPGLASLAALRSRPLYAILQDMNKESDNFTAEMLFRSAMAGSGQAGETPTDSAGPMGALMAALGFGPGSHRIVDGSGLSRYNLCTPQQLVAVLMDVHRDETLRPELLASLPIAGADGTLGNRMNGQGLQYRARAKTGTMTGISSLAGFACGREGAGYCFAMMFNNYTCGAPAVRALQDRMVAELVAINP
jgi:D-alanyl-D-alanine carboxypeptidase/D-alanyl-D-alanine-endopeptidase (penicillin-binding protein 4)